MTWILLVYYLLLVTTTTTATTCSVQPRGESIPPRTPGDGGYRIQMIEKYTPNTIYAIRLMGAAAAAAAISESVMPFTRFTLTVDSQHSPNSQVSKVGSFQLYSDSPLTSFNEDCVNTVSETSSDYPKSEIQVMWKSPDPGSGCVVFTAMIMMTSPSLKWFAEDGGLVHTVCELVESAAADCCACDDAKYSLIMEGIWSNTTHPKDFPFSAWLTHFSDLIGASHETRFGFWGQDYIATDGFRQLAEWGSASGLEAELYGKSQHLRTLVKAAGLWYPNVNTNTSTTFSVDRKHPLLSVASMLGPSPDWVVGVSKLNLCESNCTWRASQIIDLYPWDAGTDNGISYMSPNSETIPREKMKPITTLYPEDPRSPFYNPAGGSIPVPLARLYLTREKIIPRSCNDEMIRPEQQLANYFEVSENTEDTSRPECATTTYSAWSACSVSCGKGLRMRTRSYVMPDKAKMLSCNRQLVSKEMCVASLMPECSDPAAAASFDADLLLIDEPSVCKTTDWSEWSECSVTCGVGQKTKTRHFYDKMGRKKCPHKSTVEKEKCMGLDASASPHCNNNEPEIIIDPTCKVTEWTDWSPCSASCGKGVKFRTRLLMVDPARQEECSTRIELLQQRSCIVQADCTFDMATAKVVCMEEADVGPCRGYFQRWAFNAKKLSCISFGYGGCRGNRNNFLTFEECTSTCGIVRAALTGQQTPPPPPPPPPSSSIHASAVIDCMMTEWSPWSPCSVTCGTGRVTSHRTIKRQPENGGRACPRKLQRRARCQLIPCD